MKLSSLIAIATLARVCACLGAQSPVDDKVDTLLNQMTLDEKIGQMMQVDSDALKGHEQDIATYSLGSVLSGGVSNPPGGSSAQDWKDWVAKLDSYAAQTRLKIPIIYGIDAVHGHNNITSATIFPHNVGMGATRDPAAVEKAARATAEEVAGTGIDWVFAPCLAVGRDERWGRSYESYGEDPSLVAVMGAAAVRGFQGSDLAAASSVLACAKHFLGDGGTTGGRDQGNTAVDVATLRQLHLPGYIAAINAGAKSVMVSYSSWNGTKMHANGYLITGVLKGELKFQGLVVSDWAAIDQISPDYKDCVQQSINAGIDMVMIPHSDPSPEAHTMLNTYNGLKKDLKELVKTATSQSDPKPKPNTYQDFAKDLKELVADNKVPMSRIDDAVRRILRVKFELGLFEGRKGSPELFAGIGSPEHREIARDCVRKSLVLLQNRNNVLPLSRNARRIGITGKGAHDLNVQCGGWTIDWQNMSGMTLLGATTIQDAVKAAVPPQTEVVYSADGTGMEGCDVVIAVVGEGPYAETMGDRQDLGLDASDLTAVSNARKSGAPVVAVLISGRPLIIDPLLTECDGIIAAWLPGSEGEGVSDVLFGDYKPTGKLPRSWPRTMAQIPINVGDKNYEPMFPYGFGLTYQ